MQRIVSGIKNTGTPHLGNYLGMFLPMAKLQKSKVKGKRDFELLAFIPDLHALNSEIDYSKSKEQMLFMIKCYIASGLDPNDENTIIYRQSRNSMHSEMAIILHNFTSMGELSRQTQYKEKSLKNEELVNVGLFYYPVLMAADILGYGAKYVPVGDDQRQHVELTRDIALRFNNKFGEILVVPAAMRDQVKFTGEKESIRIMSLSDPTKKMSKSVLDPKGTIDLNEDLESARKKIFSATTDSENIIRYDKVKKPGISNLLMIQSLLEEKDLDAVVDSYREVTSYSVLKAKVADLVCERLEQIQKILTSVSDQQVIGYLEKGEERARELSKPILQNVQKVVGL